MNLLSLRSVFESTKLSSVVKSRKRVMRRLSQAAELAERTTVDVTQSDEFQNLFAQFPGDQLRELAARIPADLAAVLDSLPIGVTVGDRAGISFCNRRGLEMLGLASVEDLRKTAPYASDRTWARFPQTGARLHPSEEPLSLAFSSGRTATSEIIYRNCETGEEVTVECTAIPIRDNGGSVALAAAVMTLQQSMSERDRAMRALGDALRRLSLHVRNTPLAVIEWRSDFRVASWSRRAEALFGWTEAEAKALDPSTWCFTHEGDPAVGPASVAALSAGGTDGSSVFCVRNYTKDGRTLHCEWYNSVLTDSEGQFTSVLSLVQDVTARVRAESDKDAALRVQTDIADTLTRSLLLMPPSPHLPGIEIAPFYAGAMDEAYVGGDFFDAFALDVHRVALVLGDVTGKGIEAAAYIAETKFAVRAFLREHNDAGVALACLNRFLLASVRFDDSNRTAFASMTIAIFDSETRTLEVAVAGAEPPIVIRSENGVSIARALDVGGALIGLDKDVEYDVTHHRLEPGDILCMTTDGITESRQIRSEIVEGHQVPKYQFFGMEGFRQAAEDAANSNVPLDETGHHIYVRACEFAGGDLLDDACLLLARWLPAK